MTRTVSLDYIGKPNLGYALVAILSEGAKGKITSFIKDIKPELSKKLWFTPEDQLHITLCDIIQPKIYKEDKATLFNLSSDAYYNGLSATLLSLPKFTVKLDILEVSPQAIIIRSSDPSSFNAIRKQLLERIQLPAETRPPPDIIHTTIARYKEPIDLNTVNDAINAYGVLIDEQIVEFKLLKITTPPLQDYEVLKTYPLQ